MKFRQHIPNYIDSSTWDIPVYDFETVEELLALPPLTHYGKREGFSHFAKCVEPPPAPYHYLMEISNNGGYWVVVGMIVGDVSELDLQEWDEDTAVWKGEAKPPPPWTWFDFGCLVLGLSTILLVGTLKWMEN